MSLSRIVLEKIVDKCADEVLVLVIDTIKSFCRREVDRGREILKGDVLKKRRNYGKL